MHAAARARTIRAPPFIDPHGYARHRPETTLVLSLPFALRFLLATDPDALTLVLGVVYHTISRHLIGRADLTRVNGEAGAVTLVQRFGSSLNLNIHFHMIVPDGVYLPVDGVAPVFRHVSGPTERDIESAWLAGDGEPGLLDDLIGHSITYRIAVGPRAGQKLFTLQTLPAREEVDDQQGDHRGAARAGGWFECIRCTPSDTWPRTRAISTADIGRNTSSHESVDRHTSWIYGDIAIHGPNEYISTTHQVFIFIREIMRIDSVGSVWMKMRRPAFW